MQTNIVWLNKAIEWEKRTAGRFPHLETPSGLFLGIRGDGCGGYMCSPADAIQFAGTGMDGIHYALLTDYGANRQLDEAPVVCVSPMDFGNCVRIVAANLADFFALHFGGHGLLLLNDFTDREPYAAALKRELEELDAAVATGRPWVAERAEANRLAMAELGLEPFADPIGYILRIREERARRVALPTADGLGVMPVGGDAPDADSDARPLVPHPWTGRDIPYGCLGELRAYWTHARREAKLAFVRDFQAQAIADTAALTFLHEELARMGYPVEAMRLLHVMNDG